MIQPRYHFDSTRQSFVSLDGLHSYRLLHPLGSGGFGQVYAAEHTPSGRRFALKTLKPQATPAHLERLRNEAESYRFHGANPNVLTLQDADLVCQPPFIVTELMSGTLRTACKKAVPDFGAAYVGWVLASTLSRIHELGGFHRDLNPNNIFVGPPPSPDAPPRVVLGDFGLAMEPLLRDQTTHMVAGTPGYMAPELTRTGRYEAPADVFSLGVTIFEIRTLRAPHTETNYDVRRHQPAADVQLRQLILDMTRANPQERPTASAVASRAQAILQRLLAKQRNSKAPEPAQDNAAAVLALLGIGLAAAFLLSAK